MEERRVAELRQRLDDAAAGAEQLRPLVRDDDVGVPPRREMAFDLVGEVMHVDDRALDAGVGQPVEHVIDQRLAADLDQRLGDLAVVGAHARAEPGGQHHGAARRGDCVGCVQEVPWCEFRSSCSTPERARYTMH